MNQTIWNFITGRDYNYGIGDYDIFYWDKDLSSEKERGINDRITQQFPELNISFDVVNQARVHQWFGRDFGVEIPQIKSLRQALSMHSFTPTCIGINNNEIYAPYGTDDTLSMILKYNPTTHIPMKHTLMKMEKWIQKWPELKVDGKSFEIS